MTGYQLAYLLHECFSLVVFPGVVTYILLYSFYFKKDIEKKCYLFVVVSFFIKINLFLMIDRAGDWFVIGTWVAGVLFFFGLLFFRIFKLPFVILLLLLAIVYCVAVPFPYITVHQANVGARHGHKLLAWTLDFVLAASSYIVIKRDKNSFIRKNSLDA